MYCDSLTTIDGRFQSLIPQYALSESERRQRLLELSVGLLIARAEAGETWTEGFDYVEEFLETLPLATAEYRLAKSHLQNALDYCRVLEFGGATFELRVVRGMLQKI